MQAAWLLAAPLGAHTEAGRAAAAYRPLRRHPELFDATLDPFGWARWVHEPLLHALRELNRDHNATSLWALLRHELGDDGESSGVYSFRAFSDEFCALLIEELDGYYASGLPISRPNSMNNYGLVVNDIGLRAVITQLQHHVLQPLASLLYPRQAGDAAAGSGFSGHHSFIVKYRADEDLGLDMHTDDSDVTFNLCLGRNFTGAALTLCGDARQPDHRQYYTSYSHEVGRALVHLGSRRHGADEISSGERLNLIIWNTNRAYRSSEHRLENQPYHAERRAPSRRCLSYTHDRDYGVYRRYPPGRDEFDGRGWCPPPAACYDSMEPIAERRLSESELEPLAGSVGAAQGQGPRRRAPRDEL